MKNLLFQRLKWSKYNVNASKSWTHANAKRSWRMPAHGTNYKTTSLTLPNSCCQQLRFTNKIYWKNLVDFKVIPRSFIPRDHHKFMFYLWVCHLLTSPTQRNIHWNQLVCYLHKIVFWWHKTENTSDITN